MKLCPLDKVSNGGKKTNAPHSWCFAGKFRWNFISKSNSSSALSQINCYTTIPSQRHDERGLLHCLCRICVCLSGRSSMRVLLQTGLTPWIFQLVSPAGCVENSIRYCCPVLEPWRLLTNEKGIVFISLLPASQCFFSNQCTVSMSLAARLLCSLLAPNPFFSSQL